MSLTQFGRRWTWRRPAVYVTGLVMGGLAAIIQAFGILPGGIAFLCAVGAVVVLAVVGESTGLVPDW